MPAFNLSYLVVLDPGEPLNYDININYRNLEVMKIVIITEYEYGATPPLAAMVTDPVFEL